MCITACTYYKACCIFTLLNSNTDSLSNVRADLGRVQIQLTSSRSCLHPKAEWLVAKMASWSATAEGEGRRRRREKALVLVAGDFTVISAEVMNALNGVSGLSTCVFALAPKHPGDMEYLQEVEARWAGIHCARLHVQLHIPIPPIPFPPPPSLPLTLPSPPPQVAAVLLSCGFSFVYC